MKVSSTLLVAFTFLGVFSQVASTNIYTGVISALCSADNYSSITASFEPSAKASEVIGVSRTGSFTFKLPSPTMGSWTNPSCYMITNIGSRLSESLPMFAKVKKIDKIPYIEGSFAFAGSPDYQSFVISCVIKAPSSTIAAEIDSKIAPDASGNVTKKSNADVSVRFDNPSYTATASTDVPQIIEVNSFGKLASSVSVIATGSLTDKPLGLEVAIKSPTRPFNSLTLDGYNNVIFGPFNPVSVASGYIANCTMQNGEFRYGLRANFDTKEPRYLDFIFLDDTVVLGDVTITCPLLSAQKILRGVESIVSVYASHTDTIKTKGSDGNPTETNSTYTFETSTLIYVKNNAVTASMMAAAVLSILAVFLTLHL